jgi:hypothetical protein
MQHVTPHLTRKREIGYRQIFTIFWVGLVSPFARLFRGDQPPFSNPSGSQKNHHPSRWFACVVVRVAVSRDATGGQTDRAQAIRRPLV